MRALRAWLVSTTMVGLVSLAGGALAAPPPACAEPKTTCVGHSGYYAASEDLDRLTAVADPLLGEVRACLDRAGAKHVPSALVIRWSSEGKAVEVKIDAPGYESLPCVQNARDKLSALQNPRETSIRCEYGCPAPEPAPAPAPPPVVVPAPTAKEAPPPEPTPAPAPTAAPAPEAPKTRSVWYGYQTLAVDAFAFSAMIGGIASKSGGLSTGGYLGFLFAAPVVHMVHGNVGPGFASVAMRLFVPLMGLGFGAVTGLVVSGGSGSGNFGDFGERANGAVNGGVIGALIGGGVCVLIDAAAFAYTKEQVPPKPVARTRAIDVTPTFALDKGGANVGLVGRF